jgi:hypothetical protein
MGNLFTGNLTLFTVWCKVLDLQCDANTCIRYDKVCNDHVDCQDGTDEQNCSKHHSLTYHLI